VNTRTALGVLGLLFALPVSAQELRFVTCPIYRDTDAGKKSGCWLTDDPATGQRYDVSLAPTKPDWNHSVLVEGKAKPGAADVCGGVVLEPVRVSILPGDCTQKQLPAEGYPSRVFKLPARNVRPVSEPRPAPPFPHTDRTFSLVYDFGRHFHTYQLDDYLLDETITYIRGTQPVRIIVTGHAATQVVTVSGERLAEPQALAQQRAEKVAAALRRLGVAPELLEVRASTDDAPAAVAGADGLTEPSRRRVDIEVLLH
jgi:hypothetical protein